MTAPPMSLTPITSSTRGTRAGDGQHAVVRQPLYDAFRRHFPDHEVSTGIAVSGLPITMINGNDRSDINR